MPKHFVMICPSLVDQGGHEYDYTSEVAKAVIADSVEVTTFVPRAATKISLPGKVRYESCTEKLPKATAAKITSLLAKYVFYLKLFYQNRRSSIQFFIHTLSPKQLILVTLAWILSARTDNRLVLFLRHNIGTSFSDAVLIRTLRFAAYFGVDYVSDSDLLAEAIKCRLGCDITVVPIPLTLPQHPVQRANKQPVCSYLGARRRTKGFHLLPKLVDTASRIDPNLRFNIQAYMHRDAVPEKEVEAAFAELKQRPDTTVLDRVLGNEEFTQLIFLSDIALIPCDPVTYRTSTSGIFAMAVVARAVVITTEDTWMAHVTRQYKLTRVVLLPWQATVDQIHAAMHQALKLLIKPDVPTPQEKQWCDSQTAKALWNILRQL